jgi:hypothetical protein
MRELDLVHGVCRFIPYHVQSIHLIYNHSIIISVYFKNISFCLFHIFSFLRDQTSLYRISINIRYRNVINGIYTSSYCCYYSFSCSRYSLFNIIYYSIFTYFEILFIKYGTFSSKFILCLSIEIVWSIKCEWTNSWYWYRCCCC